jgi:cyclophilin family peptidyl-prolyl cis-trans isomerase
MKVTFNGESYILNYELYRKIAPSTVQHFLDLANANYFANLCIHNYTENKWYTGGYTYSKASDTYGGLQEKNYFESVASLKLTSTVWTNDDKATSTNTVYGEFEANGFKVSSGAINQSFGSLTMYYTPKDVTNKVYTKRSDGKGYDWKSYKYNSATSLFYFSMSATTVAAAKNYCTFATLKDNSVEILRDLKGAIADYIEEQKENDEEYTFTQSYEVPVDAGDSFVEGGEISYEVPASPIIIEWISVIKY